MKKIKGLKKILEKLLCDEAQPLLIRYLAAKAMIAKKQITFVRSVQAVAQDKQRSFLTNIIAISALRNAKFPVPLPKNNFTQEISELSPVERKFCQVLLALSLCPIEDGEEFCRKNMFMLMNSSHRVALALYYNLSRYHFFYRSYSFELRGRALQVLGSEDIALRRLSLKVILRTYNFVDNYTKNRRSMMSSEAQELWNDKRFQKAVLKCLNNKERITLLKAILSDHTSRNYLILAYNDSKSPIKRFLVQLKLQVSNLTKETLSPTESFWLYSFLLYSQSTENILQDLDARKLPASIKNLIMMITMMKKDKKDLLGVLGYGFRLLQKSQKTQLTTTEKQNLQVILIVLGRLRKEVNKREQKQYDYLVMSRVLEATHSKDSMIQVAGFVGMMFFPARDVFKKSFKYLNQVQPNSHAFQVLLTTNLTQSLFHKKYENEIWHKIQKNSQRLRNASVEGYYHHILSFLRLRSEHIEHFDFRKNYEHFQTYFLRILHESGEKVAISWLKSYEKINILAPNKTRYFYEKALVLFYLKRYNEALQVIKYIENQEKKDSKRIKEFFFLAKATLLKGKIYQAKGFRTKSIVSYKKAVEINFTDAEAYHLIAAYYKKDAGSIAMDYTWSSYLCGLKNKYILLEFIENLRSQGKSITAQKILWEMMVRDNYNMRKSDFEQKGFAHFLEEFPWLESICKVSK